jgi:3-deoxy-manno-octulosonate cytidylyltransferase (CMP-KDO synthetase)
MKANANVIGVIPARYNSQRLPYKLLRLAGGKTLLQWTWENACRAHMLDELIIACDHSEIEEAAKGFGANVVLTSPQHKSGTDRIAEAVRDREAKVVINIQADEPLVNASIIDRLAQEILYNDDIVMASVKKRIEDEGEINSSNVVKVICDRDGFALYFSRRPLPYYRDRGSHKVYYKHLGIYAYTKDFLFTFKNLPQSYLEDAEKLEQLRALEAGHKIKILETQFDSCGVDTEDDLRRFVSLVDGGAVNNEK